MKKKILSIAIAIAATMAIAANAQKPASCPENQECTNSCLNEKAECPRQDCKLFEGITLNDSQKAQFKALQEKCAKERKDAATAKKQAKEQREQAMKAQRCKAKQDKLKDIKSILTPEQYVVFLENFYINTPQRPDGAKKIRKGHGHDMNRMAHNRDAHRGSDNRQRK